ncbi:hypothetical protein BDN70DRAFT_963877 [Pholiota conissans]|uniref:RRM domain-containing protein n=1 Tax=Pholiota conissans TaxID=109636 RepID=A0A9P5YRE1_9AGAR|nr:hypothetical protein BDN70DRAFT_963877 [Pholiota conissans]
MAPKKAKKISLNEFLGDSGSWADEMESLPNAPAARIDEEQSGDRFGRRGDDFLSSRPDRQSGPPREDLPLPTQPPYTAFVGNLAFDLTEVELGEFFSGIKTKSVKIIRDKDEKPKGFGYIEFEDLEGLKEALSKTGSERGFGGASEDNAKFDNPWRRDGPLPDLHDSRDSSRRRFEGPSADRADRQVSSAADGVDQWRSNKPARAPETDAPTFRRKGSGFLSSEGHSGTADKDDWTIGSKFKSSTNVPTDDISGRSSRMRGDMGPPREAPSDEGDWRSAARQPKTSSRSSISPSSSTPPTPQLARRKLELLPRSGNASVSPSPLSSPKMGPATPAPQNARPNPFGAARPVDVSSRDKEVTERIERERVVVHEKLAMSRTSSRTGIERSATSRPQTPPVSSTTAAPRSPPSKPAGPSLVPTVRPTLSFANVAAAKREAASKKEAEGEQNVEAEVAGISEEMNKVVL